ncbi:class II histone deacetylase, partial [Micromonospora aurantiaca]
NGAGAGEGYTLNVPLPKGSGHAAYLYAMNTVVLPALDRFQPELILVATGFDGAYWDPLSCQALIADSYRQMARLLIGAAERLCGGRLVAVHEGGYSPWYTPWCLAGFIEGLTGANGDLTDPYAGIAAGYGAEPMLPHEQAVIDQTARLVPRITATIPAS